MLKWRLIFKALPYAIAILLLKISLIYALDFEGFIDIQEIRVILTAGVFLIGFMVAGTLSDYKESEKIPGEIAITLEAIEEISVILATQTQVDVPKIRHQMMELTQRILDRFYRRIDDDEIHETLSEYNEIVHELDRAGGAPPIVGRLIIQMHDLRKLITRTNVISKTGFLQTGYALLELLIVIVSILLLAANFNSLVAEVFIVLFVELIYIYMYKLIKDMDDPFEYGEDIPQGAAEVPLFPIRDYQRRLGKRILEMSS